MNVQHISEEDLVLYSMQSLTAGETASVALHLESCADCSHRLAEIAGDLALFSLSVEQHPLPAGARDRFTARIGTEPQATSAPASPVAEYVPEPRRVVAETAPRRSWFPILIPWAAAFAMLAVAGYLGSRNQQLDQLLNNDKGQIAQLSAEAASAQQLMDALTSPAARDVALTEGKGTPQPAGHAKYLAEKGALVFVGNNLRSIPANKTYELWIIPADGKAPVPAGLFRPDDRGSASVVLPKLPTGVRAKAFGVTIENAEGATSPTMPIVLSGASGL